MLATQQVSKYRVITVDHPWDLSFSSSEYAYLPRNPSGFSYKEETQMCFFFSTLLSHHYLRVTVYWVHLRSSQKPAPKLFNSSSNPSGFSYKEETQMCFFFSTLLSHHYLRVTVYWVHLRSSQKPAPKLFNSCEPLRTFPITS